MRVRDVGRRREEKKGGEEREEKKGGGKGRRVNTAVVAFMGHFRGGRYMAVYGDK